MLAGPMRLAQSAFAWVWTTALGREVVPDVNMMPAGAIGSAGRAGSAARRETGTTNGLNARGSVVEKGRGRVTALEHEERRSCHVVLEDRDDIGERWYEDSDRLHAWGYLREA